MSFGRFCAAFQSHYANQIEKALHCVFDGDIELSVAPLSPTVVDRFMKIICDKPSTRLRPAFHGTSVCNHSGIFKDGLLIPGQGNTLKVANGSAHGLGIYTANLNAAWLSRGFCDKPKILVCAVLQTGAVRHVFDAMVVFNAAHVVPLLVGEGRRFHNCSHSPGMVNMGLPKQITVSELLPQIAGDVPPPGTATAMAQRGTNGGAGVRSGKPKQSDKEKHR